MTVKSWDGKAELEKLIVANFPKDALMACQDAYYGGDSQGRLQAAGFAPGHRRSAIGQRKHFVLNETFYEALLAHGAAPTPLSGTRLVIGRFGLFNVVRLNVPGHKWTNLRRSATRAKLAEINNGIENKYVQGDFFAAQHNVANGTVFILGVMDGVDENGVAQLTQVMVALPAPDMKSWLYIESMTTVLKLYDQVDAVMPIDQAVPKLKARPKKQADDDQRN